MTDYRVTIELHEGSPKYGSTLMRTVQLAIGGDVAIDDPHYWIVVADVEDLEKIAGPRTDPGPCHGSGCDHVSHRAAEPPPVRAGLGEPACGDPACPICLPA